MDVNDKVEVIDYDNSNYIGKVGTIIEENLAASYDFEVKFENGHSEFFHEDELILVDEQEENFFEKATDKQVGGSHYSDFEIQPISFVLQNEEHLHPTDAFLLNNVLKYVIRHRRRGGEDDLEKAIHYIEIVKEHTYD